MTDLLEELQRMAMNSQYDEHIETAQIERWQKLFGFSHVQAREQIQRHRTDVGLYRVSNELWQLVQDDNEALGHDHESYEFSLRRETSRKPHVAHSEAPLLNKATYIVKLESPIDTAEKIHTITQSNQEPHIFSGHGDTGTAIFCEINAQTLQKLLSWIAITHPHFHPTTVRLSRSPKQLCDFSMAPMLGMETTLPHYRPDTMDFQPSAQQQWPVWYFFYGNLARSEELQRRLGLTSPPAYVPARVYGATIRSWRGQYKALVDNTAEHFEDGSAYLVASEQDEDTLRFYETDMYEVVRCNIHMNDQIQPGLVFRFCGGESEIE